MPDLSFFQNMHHYFMRVSGTIVGVYYLSEDGRTPIEGIFVASQEHAREIIFDRKKWQTKRGFSSRKLEYMIDVGVILLDRSEFQNGEDLPELCLERLEPKIGSAVWLPTRIVLKYDLWMSAEPKINASAESY